MNNITTWTGLSVEESIRMTEDRDKWRKYVHGVANLGSRTAKEQNRSNTLIVSIVAFCTEPLASVITLSLIHI